LTLTSGKYNNHQKSNIITKIQKPSQYDEPIPKINLISIIRAGQLSEKDCQTIQNILSDPQGHGIPLWFLNRRNDWKDGTDSQLVTNGLETRLRENLERMKKVRKHRGLRHHWGLKVRGQRTKTTGRRGATMGVIKKK